MPANRKSPVPVTEPRLRRTYFEVRYGQLHVHHAIPPGGGFDEHTTLICIHDRDATARTLLPLLATFGRTRSVYAPDLPGAGESDAPPAAERDPLSAAVAALGDFIADMRLRQVDLIGVGTGADVARAFAVKRGAEVRRVALLGQRSAGRPATAVTPSQPLLELPAAPLVALAGDPKLAEFLK
jgi:pimeloyl-ACP methyl ester carboxylesterase